jgi:glycosyltransferase involved in cell wall biosynthesis
MNVVVLGRFPPPVDGQTMATRRVADLLRTSHTVYELDTEPADRGFVAAEARWSLHRFVHYVRSSGRIRSELRDVGDAVVLWTSISPVRLGHWRDVSTVLPAFRDGQRIIAVVHRAGFHDLFESSVTRVTAAALVRRVDGFVFLDDALAARCQPWIPDAKRFTIPNTIDDEVVCSEREVEARALNTERPFCLLFLSNMLPEKGFLDVLDAVARLRERGVAVRADFVGRWVSNEDRVAFERVVDARRLGPTVTHHGAIADRGSIKQLYLDADAFVLPTYHPTEAQPLTIIEALNAGTPVITTGQGGIRSMVGDGDSARIVPPRDSGAIAAAIESLRIPAHWKATSLAARKRFVDAFSPERVRRMWNALIDQSEAPSSRMVT